MRKLLIVVGTRPNFIKITCFKKVNAAMGSPFEIKIVHTGQHYDDKMAAVFFEQFELTPDYFLNIPAASANTQMAEIMLRLEKVLSEYQPSLVLVPGDVNSTFAAALTCNKMNIPIAHIESGLRSFDRTMPEEFNRILTDEVADYFFVTEQSGYDHLVNEGKNPARIFFTGNTMIDTMVAFDSKISESLIMEQYKLKSRQFVLMTMHRPATVDHREGLQKLIEVIEMITKNYSVLFPIHPRTLHKAEQFGLKERIVTLNKLILTEPLDYFGFQKLIRECRFVITDSGGIQEETTFRQIPCLTLRSNTERPVTVTEGTNELIPFDLNIIRNRVDAIVNGTYKKGAVPKFWDGHATQRILEACLSVIPGFANSAKKVLS